MFVDGILSTKIEFYRTFVDCYVMFGAGNLVAEGHLNPCLKL